MAVDMRSLPREAKFAKRVEVIALRRAGRSYVQIARQVGLSRTGVFDICKRHAAAGDSALRDAPAGRGPGEGRTLTAGQERMLRRQIIDSTPDELGMPEPLWGRTAVSRLIEQRLGIVLPDRTLALYLTRWGFTARRPKVQPGAHGFLLLNAWLTDRYPQVFAQSRFEGGQITWAGGTRLTGRQATGPPEAAAGVSAPEPERSGRRGLSMVWALTNMGQLRWTTFNAPLDARTWLDFLQRLIRGASKKVFLIVDDLCLRDERQVRAWLVEHEDAIEVCRLPARSAVAAS